MNVDMNEVAEWAEKGTKVKNKKNRQDNSDDE